jgi:hypothetical protein
VKVITVERAVADRIDANSIRQTAAWNESAAKVAKMRKDTALMTRLLAQAEALRTVAAAIDAL